MPPFDDPRQFDAVIFDLGSTLVYFSGVWEQVAEQRDRLLVDTLEAAGLKLDEKIFLAGFRSALESYMDERDTEFIEYTTALILKNVLAEQGYPNVSEQTLRQALDNMFSISQVLWNVEEDTLDTLESLKKAGYRLAILSNTGDDADVQAIIDRAGIRSYFDVIVSSASQGIRKPHPRLFKIVLDRLGVAPERAVMVGDTLGADILGAHNAGIKAVWITRRADKAANRAHEDTIQPDATISTLGELLPLLGVSR